MTDLVAEAEEIEDLLVSVKKDWLDPSSIPVLGSERSSISYGRRNSSMAEARHTQTTASTKAVRFS